MPIFEELLIWNDLTPHSGAQNMAIDELLLQRELNTPLVRFYSWDAPAVSFGYFETLSAAQTSFPNTDDQLTYIRRWTGGGIVDHRIDLTYTLVIPRSHPSATLRGAESYRIIHEAVAAALNDGGISCRVIDSNAGDGSAACFQNPVAYDIVTPEGAKLAGAGQKRSRYGLLHQGSVIGIEDSTQWQQDFVNHISSATTYWQPDGNLLERAKELEKNKYSTPKWLNKR